MQQPPQFPGPQVGCATQIPPLPVGSHIAPKLVQLVHCCPPAPHEVGKKPGSHRLPKQHPAQLPGPHAGCSQRPFSQVSPTAAQLEHSAPRTPQAVGAKPAVQTFPSQHPGQFSCPQFCIWVMHCREPMSHASKPSARQFWQKPPPDPQAVLETPGSQNWPFGSQQPNGQELGSHVLPTESSDTSLGESAGESSPESSGPPSVVTR
jgi:hypothetical protein